MTTLTYKLYYILDTPGVAVLHYTLFSNEYLTESEVRIGTYSPEVLVQTRRSLLKKGEGKYFPVWTEQIS